MPRNVRNLADHEQARLNYHTKIGAAQVKLATSLGDAAVARAEALDTARTGYAGDVNQVETTFTSDVSTAENTRVGSTTSAETAYANATAIAQHDYTGLLGAADIAYQRLAGDADVVFAGNTASAEADYHVAVAYEQWDAWNALATATGTDYDAFKAAEAAAWHDWLVAMKQDVIDYATDTADATAGDELSSVAYGSAELTATAGGSLTAYALGSMTVIADAGYDAWVVAYDDLELDLSADHDVELVWAWGDLEGAINAGNRIGRVKSYRAIDATITAGTNPPGDVYYGLIEVVEAWESIAGQISTPTSILTVRGGEEVTAVCSSAGGATPRSFDHAVRGSLPRNPSHGVSGSWAFLNGAYRDVLLGQLESIEATPGILLAAAASFADWTSGQGITLGEPAALAAVVQNTAHAVTAELAAIAAADEALLADARDAMQWQMFVAPHTAENIRLRLELLLHQADTSLAMMQHARADMEAAFLNDREAMIADKLEVRNAEFARLAEAIENRLDTWRDDAQQAVWSGIRNVMAENTKETLRLVGTVASVIPGGQLVGAVCSLGAGTISAVQGNKTEAAIEFVCAVPGMRNFRGQTAALKGSVGLGTRSLVRGTTRVIGGTTRMTARAATGGFRAITNGQTWSKLGWGVRRAVCPLTGGRWCFVGDTGVPVDELPKELTSGALAAGFGSTEEESSPWLWSSLFGTAAVAGVAGIQWQRRRRREMTRAAARDWLFAESDDDDLLDPGEPLARRLAMERIESQDQRVHETWDAAFADDEIGADLCLTGGRFDRQ